MIIESKNNNKTHDVSPEEWEKMGTLGMQKNFTVLKESSEVATLVPEESKTADFPALIKEAKEKENDGLLSEALELFKLAFEIKETKVVGKKIAALEGILSK